MKIKFKNPFKTGHKSYYKVKSNNDISSPLIFVVVIIGLIFLMSVIFRVSVINVYGNEHYTVEEIINAVDIEEGDNLFFFDRFAAVSRVFAKLPYVEEVSIERSLPNKVEITVSESKAMAYLQVGDEKWTMDHNCKILGKAADGEDESLLCVKGIDPGTLLIGELLTTSDGSEDVVNYLAEVLSQIQDRGLNSKINQLTFKSKNNLTFIYADKYTVLFGDAAKVEYKFGMLLSAVSQLLEGDIGTIDVSSANYAYFTPD